MRLSFEREAAARRSLEEQLLLSRTEGHRALQTAASLQAEMEVASAEVAAKLRAEEAKERFEQQLELERRALSDERQALYVLKIKRSS